MIAHPIVVGLLYQVRGYGLCRLVYATNGAHAIEIATESMSCAS